MKTDDLIQALAADTTPQTVPAHRLWRALPLALVLPLVALVVFWQVRPDLARALASFPVYKTAVPAALSLAALWLGLELTHPEARALVQKTILGAVLAALAAALAYGLATTSPAQIAILLDTPDYVNCLVSVPVLALLPLAVMLWSMRAGAPRNPTLAGAVAGMVAGGAGAAIYSLHCPHDALMYFFSGYGVAIAAVTAAGALVGRSVLRW